MQLECSAPYGSVIMDPQSARGLLTAQYGYFCFRCLKVPVLGERQLTVDHIVPKSLGGLSIYANYQLLCPPCNGAKFMRVIDYRPGTRHLDVTWPRERVYLTEGSDVGSEPPSEPGFRWVSFSEAMKVLGTSEGTLRRMIRSGAIMAEAEPREPGTGRIRYRIRIPAPSLVDDSEADDTRQEASGPSLDQLLDMHAEVIEAYQQLAAKEREIADLRERAASAEASASHETARANAAEARAAQLAEALAAERARPWWRRLLRG
jgi:hypothetical protein